jgi:hypothetical protein
MKAMALDAIHDDLVRTLGKDAVTCSTVTKYARSAQFSGRKEATPPEAPDVELSLVDEAILTALAEFLFPFSSVRELSRTGTGISRNHFASRCDIFDGSPLLTAEQKQIRVLMAIELLQVLSVQNKARASGTTLSPWTSCGFICSVGMI